MAEGPRTSTTFRGRALGSRPGETLVQTLARRGVPILQRSIRYHRPRAPFCGVGACTQCLVRVNGVPNVRACVYVPSPGDTVETENAWPSPRFDLLGVLDGIFFRGLDTSHGFRRPGFLVPLYHRVVRHLAGYGRWPDPPHGSPPVPAAGRTLETDVLVIGGGGAGMAAVGKLANAGVPTLLVDRQRPTVPAGVTMLAQTTVVFLPPRDAAGFRAVAAPREGPGLLLRARRVVVTTGGYDGPLLFAGNDRPGVMTAEGALSTVARDAPAPFHRAVVFGGGARVLPILDRFGSEVEAIVAPGTVDPEVTQRASALEIPLFPRTLLLRASGRRRVRALHLLPRAGGAAFRLEADAVVLAHRRLPNAQLFYQAGARMSWRPIPGAYFPEITASGGTTVPDLFAAGGAAGYHHPPSAEASGLAAADAVLGHPWPPDALAALHPTESGPEFEPYYRELLAATPTGPKRILCPCEDVLLREVEDAVARGYRGIEVVKRLTGVGTGLCQGRYCLPDALLLLAILEGRPAPEVGYITQRPPVLPTSLSALAGLPEDVSEAVSG